MKTYSIYLILFLCFVILVVDIASFYWLQYITQLINFPFLKKIINILFWIFTIGLITSILILRITLNKLQSYKKQLYVSSLFGLTVSSLIPKFVFICVISFLYFSNYFFSKQESIIIVPFVGLFSGFLPFFVIIFGIFKTIYWFKVEKIRLNFNHLPNNFDGLRIVHFSDLHLGSFSFRYSVLQKVIDLINDLKPDFIFFTGDLVNNYAWELKGWTKIFNQLNAKTGKYAVLGNHDYGDYSTWKSEKAKEDNLNSIKYFYHKIGFKLLLNSSDIIDFKDDKIAIVGVENWGVPPFKKYGDLQRALNKVKEIPFKILLSHDPTHWEKEVLYKTNIALTLSGHTHGMQAGIQLKKKQWSPIKYKYKHWAGLYKINEQVLNVNKGIGWIGFPGRLGVRPEISLIELFSR